jgi:hypothetical protein
VWLPLKLEKLTLATRLSPDECRARLARTTSHLIGFFGSPQPVRGLVRERAFYLGPGADTRAWLRTWISGQIRRVEQKTVIEVSIGPNRVAGTARCRRHALRGRTVATVLLHEPLQRHWRSVICPGPWWPRSSPSSSCYRRAIHR